MDRGTRRTEAFTFFETRKSGEGFREPKTLLTIPVSWDEVFTVLDEADFPAEFMREREQGKTEAREPISNVWASDLSR